ncbi:MAG: 30S ribosomal protein S1 [Candidatus Krumholzibacteriota bacterium]|nr:30S ribosomal protein S1 [Candidatus Krumholzibacteriota bacterium]
MENEQVDLEKGNIPEEKNTKKKEGDNKSNGKTSYLQEFGQVPSDELSKESEKDIFSPDGSLDENIEIVQLKEGRIVKGKVYSVDEKEVVLDIGFKSEGAIPIDQFQDCKEVKAGDEFDVFLEKLENQDGLVVLSKKKADFHKAWNAIKDAYDNAETVKATVDRRIKGGLMIKLMGVDAFLPGSQIALRQIPNLEELIGEELECRIIKINKRRRNIVVSRRIVLEKRREKEKDKLLSDLEVGEVREGIVKNITDFGAFVDLGGIDGLLHLTDLTWGRISHPSEFVAIGDKLQVKILDFDKERERISLGLKQLTPYPWEDVEEKFPVGETVKGKVVSITDYGAFVELEKGVEGLIHISEMSWTRHVKHPSKVVGICDQIEAVVLNVDKKNEKISLGLKQLEPDPWKSLEKKYSPGTKLIGKVRNLTNFGAFVEIEDGIDGLVHISDMSWAKRVRHPSEVLKKGQEVEVVVLDIDSDKRRISLGIKQVKENPWDKLAEEFTVGKETEGKISRLLDRGAVVEIKDNVEGFVPLSHMGLENLKKPSLYFDTDSKVPLKVIKMDPSNKKIVLSINAYFEDKDESEYNEFLEALKTPDPSELLDENEPEVPKDEKDIEEDKASEVNVKEDDFVEGEDDKESDEVESQDKTSVEETPASEKEEAEEVKEPQEETEEASKEEELSGDDETSADKPEDKNNEEEKE